MGESLVAKTYGNALYEAACEAGKEELILEEIRCLSNLIETEAGFRELLTSPAVPAAEKKLFADAVLRGRASEEMINFLFVLIDKDRVWHLSRIARHYEREHEAAKGISSGRIISAVPLTEEQVVASEEAMSGLLRKHVTLKNEVDSCLIGGVKIQVDGKLIDRSLKGELSRMLEGLKQ